MFRWFASAIVALAALIGTTAATAQTAHPALWVVEDEDTTIYLFGTVHALPPGLNWLRGPIRTAFDASDELVVESLVTDEDDYFDALLAYGIASDGRRITQRLNAEQRARFTRHVAQSRMPLIMMDVMEPWVPAMMLERRGARRDNWQRRYGAETILEAAAERRAIPVTALENIDLQFGVFGHLSMPAQIALLEETMTGMDDPTYSARLLRAWTGGDVETLAQLNTEGFGRHPELYDSIGPMRNERWAGWIQLRLDEPGGKFFVAVGAAHLAGPDSVFRFLNERGITARRIPNAP